MASSTKIKSIVDIQTANNSVIMGFTWPQTTEQTILAILMVAAVMYIARLIFKPREPLSVGFMQGGTMVVAQKPASGIPDNGLAIGPAIDARGRYQTLAALRENMCGGMDAQCKCDGNETI